MNYIERSLMMRKIIIKSSFVLVVCYMVLFSAIITAYAHEQNPKAFPRSLSYSPSMKIVVANIVYDLSFVLNSNCRQQLRYAINDWEWEDNGHVSLQEVNGIALPYVFFSDTMPAGYPDSVLAVTIKTNYQRNQSMYIYSGALTGPIYTESGLTKMNICKVYANQIGFSKNNLNNTDIHKTWTHEIGHILGLYETNDGTRSVMKQGIGHTFGWNEYWKPQTHDKNDLCRFNYRFWYN